MTREQYIIECDVLLSRIYYKSSAPWLIKMSEQKTDENELDKLIFSWVKEGTNKSVPLLIYEIPSIGEQWLLEENVTITDVLSFMKTPEEYKAAIKNILDCEEFMNDIDDQSYYQKMNTLVDIDLNKLKE